MKKSWFYRMLFSYIPIFFIINALLFVLFFQEMNSQAMKDTIRANELLLQNVKDRVDYELKMIDEKFIRVSLRTDLNNLYLMNFYEQPGPFSNIFVNYMAVQEIYKVKQENPWIHSVFLVRLVDRTMLSERNIMHFNNYHDPSFIRRLENPEMHYEWSGVRSISNSPTPILSEENVVTLTRPVYPIVGGKGLIVINVKTNAIYEMIDEMITTEVSLININDADNHSLFGNRVSLLEENNIVSEFRSDYTGWTFQGGFAYGSLYNSITLLSSIWFVLGITLVVLGILFIFYVTKRNYKPVESIISKISSLAKKEDRLVEGPFMNDEFNMIQSTIEDFIEQSNHIQHQHKGDLRLRKKHFFYELIEGTRLITRDEWDAEMDEYKMRNDFARVGVVVIEIDNYQDFCTEYHLQDQNLIKYALANVSNEIIDGTFIACWCDWVSRKRLACIVLMEEQQDQLQNQLLQACRSIQQWITDNLKMTVTIGVGTPTVEVSDIHDCYREANDVLKYKIVKGNNRIIEHWEVRNQSQIEFFSHLQLIQSIVFSYRMGEDEWRDKFIALCGSIKVEIISRQDTVSLMNYLIFQLDRGISGLSEESQAIWKKEAFIPLNMELERVETMEHLEQSFESLLTGVYKKIHAVPEVQTHGRLAINVRDYIKLNYMNPDLSLKFLSDKFDVNPKYLSQLFKKEFGENFVNYFIYHRVERAKALLTDTAEQIQNISHQVGYTNPMSFYRVFKKTTGLSPGDYRKKMEIG